MKTHALLALVALEAAAVAANKVVPLSFSKRKQSVAPEAKLQRRASTISATLDNADVLYTINVTVGTPPQKLTLQVDTGSSDVWMPASSVDCKKTQDDCRGGTFNQKASSTFDIVDAGGFNISYVDGTGSTGDYFTDNFSFGGITVDKLQMGLALETTIGSGIMGIAYADGEAVCNTEGPCNEYPSIMQDLVTQGFIQSKSYSLWLDDLDASTGQLLFGGVDTAKYKGDLIALPIQPDSQSFTISSFTVSWVNLTLNANGKTINFVPSNFASPAIFDSGTSVTVLPDDIAKAVLSQLGAQYSNEFQGYIGNCAVGKAMATFDYTFGGPGGPTISVPISELFEPATDENGNPVYTNGEQICQVGVMPAQGDPVLFGDTFLRSAYVVYDLDNNEIGLANTNFNPSGSNIVEIGKNGIPGISSTASAVSVDQTATTGFLPPTGSPMATGSMPISFSASGSALLGGYFTATAGAAASTSKASSNIASPNMHGAFDSTAALLMTGCGIMMAAFGGSLIFL